MSRDHIHIAYISLTGKLTLDIQTEKKNPTCSLEQSVFWKKFNKFWNFLNQFQ